MTTQGLGSGRAVGWVLLVMGGLWVLLSGGCTLFSFWLILAMGQTHGEQMRPSDLVALAGLILFALVCIAPGIGLVWAGRVLLKR